MGVNPVKGGWSELQIKFNRTSDGPQNVVKTTTTDIGEFTITV